MTTARVTSIGLSQYGSTPSGSMNFACDDGSSFCIPIDKDMAQKLMTIALAEFSLHQKKMAEALSAIQPAPLLGYDESKTIDLNDEIPF